MWIDSHAHLYEYTGSRLMEIVRSACEAKVEYILNAATNLTNARVVLTQSSQFESLFACIGISPFDVLNLEKNWYEELEKIVEGKKVKAIGECGLDCSNPAYPSLEQQTPIFLKQLELAKKLNIPAIIHSRGAELKVLDAVKATGVQKAVFHCFTGELPTMKRILDAGYIISFSGIATFKKEPLNEQIRYCPLDQMLIETDSPYLAPVPFRGKKNQPCYLPFVGQKIAQIKGISVDNTASTIYQTCRRLFFDAP